MYTCCDASSARSHTWEIIMRFAIKPFAFFDANANFTAWNGLYTAHNVQHRVLFVVAAYLHVSIPFQFHILLCERACILCIQIGNFKKFPFSILTTKPTPDHIWKRNVCAREKDGAKINELISIQHTCTHTNSRIRIQNDEWMSFNQPTLVVHNVHIWLVHFHKNLETERKKITSTASNAIKNRLWSSSHSILTSTVVKITSVVLQVNPPAIGRSSQNEIRSAHNLCD